jgi:hypothetical protein
LGELNLLVPEAGSVGMVRFLPRILLLVMSSRFLHRCNVREKGRKGGKKIGKRKRGKERSYISFLLERNKGINPIVIISPKPNYLPKTPHPNTITMWG